VTDEPLKAAVTGADRYPVWSAVVAGVAALLATAATAVTVSATTATAAAAPGADLGAQAAAAARRVDELVASSRAAGVASVVDDRSVSRACSRRAPTRRRPLSDQASAR